MRTKFQGHRPFGSREEDFFKVSSIYERVGHFGHVTQDLLSRLSVPDSIEARYEI